MLGSVKLLFSHYETRFRFYPDITFPRAGDTTIQTYCLTLYYD
jgi:hypothetical protein